ncbi:MAG: guanylate kinase [Clostridia bacterium]|nr:guanylate kinase [Clostridia bacterium]
MENLIKGNLLVLSGPSGCGKNTVLDALMAKDDAICQTVSATTRAARVGERNGVDYYFLSEKDFLHRVENDEFVEYVKYANRYYGTLKSEIDSNLNSGKTVVMVIEVNGAQNIKRLYPQAKTIFLMPPSPDLLRDRILGRGEMDAEELDRRLSIAMKEMEKKDDYDFIVINDELDKAVEDVYKIINL